MADIEMKAAIFFAPYLPNALRQALNYAGDDGFVASMPQLLHARVQANYDNIIWNTWFTSNAEESVRTEDDDDHLHGYDAEYGMGGDATLGGMARYVAVAPNDASTSLRDLDFEL